MEKVPMTMHGHDKLQQELKHLTTVERPSVIAAISAAREHGDLSENAEYQTARERQGFIEGRIAEIEDKLSRAEVIDVAKLKGDQIMFGAKVQLIDEDTNENAHYQIVGTDEADVNQGLLSITSPLARALISKKAQDTVEVRTPGGIKGYIIQAVTYA